ncbi:hypothetical protein AKI39_05955 [Bordetella sp. H567]|uniref:hypothetical protein n=1 Tax=Bordetella sp. H567 TaxID=1697043 RepID=UPI00081CA6B0|nr:hypothetical protein [Bordetella sp. H567]AOB30333.1 hypothetical protein AKI39_05955 [Bordetella sp. H567]
MRDTLTHLDRTLPKEDIKYMNVRGTRGSPDSDQDRFTALAKRIYDNPANPDQSRLSAYYAGQPASDMEPQAGPTNPAPGLRPSTSNTEAILVDKQSILLPTTEIPSWQMTALLQEAKLVLAQRGVDGEAQVAEAMDIIDAVLRNIQSFETISTSEQAREFNNVYSLDIKKNCEFVVGCGRDPYPLVRQLDNRQETDASFDKRFQQAMESVRPQARSMAEELKDILRPYAQMSPPRSEKLADEAASAGQTPAQPSGTWQRA